MTPSGPPYWGWSDPDKKKPVTVKLLEALAAFEQRYGQEPRHVLVSGQTLTDLQTALQNGHRLPPLQVVVEAQAEVPAHTFYVQ